MQTRTPSNAARSAGLATALALTLLQAACGGGHPETDVADAAQRTAAAGSAAPVVATHEPAAARDEPLEVDMRCCGEAAVEEAVGLVWALQAAYDLPNGVPVVLRGQDLRLAMAAARRLADGGLTHVVVLQP
jgi:hypothetical protein